MPVPTHGPRCRTRFCHPSKCKECRQEVFYWACTCGSSLLFDRLGEPWPRHKCPKKGAVVPLRTSSARGRSEGADATNPMLSVRCEVCGTKMRRKELREHEWFVHRKGKKPSGARPARTSIATIKQNARPVASSGAGSAPAGKSLVLCPLCASPVMRKNLDRHLAHKCPNRRNEGR